MAYIKDMFGNIAEAFDFLMKKEFAIQILKGEKKIEFRSFFSDKYCAQICKKYKPEDKKDPDYMQPKDIGCIHFHDMGNTWFLDVSIEAVDEMAVHPQNAEYLHKYGHHEYDNEMADLEARNVSPKDITQVQWFFMMPITAILRTNIDLSEIPNVTAYEIPDECKISDPERLKKAELFFKETPTGKWYRS